MILLTVGTQLPFDRFVKLVDEWACKNPEVEILAQIASGTYTPKHMEYVDYLDEKRYAEVFEKAEVILAHAGMGSVISSLIASKPVIVYPRKASLGEHRNEHQLATCQKLSYLKGCYIAYEPEALFTTLDELSSLEGGSINPYANDDLLATIDNFIAG
ncbi:MAG: hypothetical protein GY744_14720 [Gammaproteobacteria bacterium]|nr:hypothetical protein [Gammaproteobacteria bacterium]